VQAKIDDQLRILRLAELDLLLTSLKQRIQFLPESIAHKELNIEFETNRDLRIAAETELSDMSAEINRAESDVEQVVNRIEKDDKRLNAGQGTPKELEQMQHELLSLNARRAELEEIELEVMLRVDTIKDRIKELQEKEIALQVQLDAALLAKENALKNINSEISASSQNRSQISAETDKALIDLYEKIHANGITGAAKLLNGKCGGCNLAINAGDLTKLLSLPAEEVARCEECRCILVRV
jgi:predicted  nucleic acid-binding Zn-ribbon protein